MIQREKSILSKLIAIGGATEGESFEVQVKVPITDNQSVLDAIQNAPFEILYTRHYHEYDVYFMFPDPSQGFLRYREDEYIDEKDQITNVRYRLTLIGPAREHPLESDVLLSRSRFLAPATHSLRFYREYFKPNQEISVEKHRLRWRILYKGTEFFINLDRVDQPQPWGISWKSRVAPGADETQNTRLKLLWNYSICWAFQPSKPLPRITLSWWLKSKFVKGPHLTPFPRSARGCRPPARW